MDLRELKRKKEENLLAHKKKKRAYYLKTKLRNQQKEVILDTKNCIDYETELFHGNFSDKLREIARKQKKHIESREKIIQNKIQEYKEKKRDYYAKHKEERLEYDKEYREKKKENLKEYRKKYYKQNREMILAKQKENRANKKIER